MKNIHLCLIAFGLLITSCYDANSSLKNKYSEELENKILKELKQDLKQNLDDINSNINSLKISNNANKIIINNMENNIQYNDSLDYHFANLYPYLVFSPNQTTFKYLEQTGMFQVSNDSIRASISNLYGVKYQTYKSFESIYFVEHYTNYVKPMFMKEFVTFQFYGAFKPKNYSQFIKNKDYKRVMRYTTDAIQTFIFMQSDLKEEVEKLISAIDKELN